MDSERLLDLLNKHKDNRLSEAEQLELNDWYESLDSGKTLAMSNPALADEMLEQFRETRLKSLKPQASVRRMWGWQRIAAAAILLIVLAGGVFYVLNRNNRHSPELTASDPQEKRFKNDVDPGKHRAMLTLANGQTVILDSAAGTITDQAGAKVLNQEGILNYELSGTEPAAYIAYNTLTTAKGEIYHVRLSDGTRVWLNSGSSLRYPVVFARNERVVEITGEAYFEVNPMNVSPADSRMPVPFIVKKGNMQVQVLGTHFNVNTYEDEKDIKVTLLEGAVKVSNKEQAITIRPGQQALVNSSTIQLSNPDLQQVIAWKNGVFNFTNVDIQEIMRQAARWYDIEVVYQGNPSGEKFRGKISRDARLSELLEVLELTDVRFIIDGKKITVIQ